MIYTEADFDRLSWHDCHIWGIELRAGDADDGDWTSDLALDIDWGRLGSQVSLHPASIGDVERERLRNQKVYLDRPYYSWRIRLNWPDSSEIVFGAVGFTQTLRAEPVLTEKQCLSLGTRSRLSNR